MKKTILTIITGLALASVSSVAGSTNVSNEYIDGSKAVCQSIRTNRDLVDHERVKTDSEYAKGVSEGKIIFSNDI